MRIIIFSLLAIKTIFLCQVNDLKNAPVLCDSVPDEFKTSIFNILTDSLDRNSDFIAAPPEITCSVLNGLQKELKKDSALYYFKLLYYPDDSKKLLDAKRALDYFLVKELPYCLMSSSVHWSIDLRLLATEKMSSFTAYVIGDIPSPYWFEMREKANQDMLKFCIYLLENYKGPSAGSENVTIHNGYRCRLAFILDTITNEKNTLKSPYKGYFNKREMDLWKLHIKQ